MRYRKLLTIASVVLWWATSVRCKASPTPEASRGTAPGLRSPVADDTYQPEPLAAVFLPPKSVPLPPKSVPSQPERPQAQPHSQCPIPLRDLRRELPGRLVAIGDLHGDLAAARRALILAGAIDASDSWIGGNLTLVQTGDILDRGDDEQAILDLLERLEGEARAAGGSIVLLQGNHELMNAMGDFRYVTRGGFEDFFEGEVPVPLTREARIRAFFPGGAYARKFAAHDMVTIIGDSVFVHGGVLPQFTRNLVQSNRAARCYLLGATRGVPPPEVMDPQGPLWTRAFSTGNSSCQALERSLSALGAARMVVGHTPQMGGITSACNRKVWRIDTGMARFYGGPTQVLQIENGALKILR